MRILKGYSKDEQKELEEAKDNGFLSAMTLIDEIGDDYDYCHSLTRKYIREDISGNNQLARDIVDYYDGKAKFADQKYYVKMIRNNESSYLNRNGFGIVQTEFTEQEIKDIDPRYMAFAVPVEADDE